MDLHALHIANLGFWRIPRSLGIYTSALLVFQPIEKA